MIASRYSVSQSASLAGFTRGSSGAGVGIAANFAARLGEVVEDRRQLRDGAAIDQESLGRAADAGAPHLGVEHDLPRLGRIGVAVDIGVAVAVQMGDDGDAALVLHPLDQALAAARHDDVDEVVEAQHLADRGAVGGRHKLDGLRRQIGRAQAVGSAPRIAREE